MNKKEQAALEAALTAAALRSTSPVAPDVVPDNDWRVIVTGWVFNPHTLEIRQVWVKGYTTYREDPSIKNDYLSGSREVLPMFSTRLLALKAMRYEVEQLAARQLRKVDRAIEQAQEAGE